MHVPLRLDRDRVRDIRGQVGDVQAASGADLHHPALEAGDQLPTVLIRAALLACTTD